MRICTPCFNSFVKSLLLIDDVVLTHEDYKTDPNGFITHWYNVDIEYHAVIYSQSWNDAASNYKRF